MVGLLLVGHRRRSRSSRSRRSRRSTTRPSSSRRSCPARSAETMASSVTTPLERQFGQMPSLDADDQRVELRLARRSRCSSTWTATSTPPSRTCRPRSTPPRACCPPTLPTPPTYSQEQPGRPADPHARGQLRRPAARPGRRLRRLDPRAEDLAGLRRRPGHASTAARSRRCACRSIPRRSPAPGLTPRGRAQRARRGQRQPAQGQHRRPAAGLHARRPTISSTRPTGSSRSSSPTRTARPSACRTSPNVDRRRRERAARRLGRRASAPSSSTSSASPAPTSSRSPTA